MPHLLRHITRAAPLLALALRLSAGEQLLLDEKEFCLWLLYPAEKALKDDALGTTERVGQVTLSAAKGEFEPFVLVLRPRAAKPLMDVRLELEPLRHEKGLQGEPLTLDYQRISYVHVDQPSGASVLPQVGDKYRDEAIPFGSSGKTGCFPDRLIPDPITVAELGENTQFWFTLTVPEKATAGLHRGVLRLRLRGLEPTSIPVAATVYDFTLPRSPSLRNTACWGPQYLDKVWDKAQMKALYRDMAQHRQTPDPIVPQPVVKVNADGSVEVDTKDYDEMMAYCLDELGLRHFFFPRVGGAWYTNVYFLWHTPAVREERWHGVRILDEDLSLTPEFQKTFGQYVRTMMDHFRRKGWLERAKVYMTTMDEPAKPEDFTAIRNFGGFVKSVAPEVRMFCTIYPRSELLGAVDAWCPQRYDEAEVRDRQAKGDEMMFYKNWVGLIDMPMVNPRLYGWMAWKTGAVGWLTYHTMGRWNRAWDEPYALYANQGIKAWGLGLWWYPDLLAPRILKSVRWEMMREGAEDYEYLALLAKRLASLPEERQRSPEAQAAKAFLGTAADKVVLYPGVLPAGRDDGWKTRPNFTTSHRVVWELRNEAARHIQRLAAD